MYLAISEFAFCLNFKTSPYEKLFHVNEFDLPVWNWRCGWNTFTYDLFRSETLFSTEAKDNSETAIVLALVGYEMVIANEARRASLAIYLLLSNARSLNNC